MRKTNKLEKQGKTQEIMLTKLLFIKKAYQNAKKALIKVLRKKIKRKEDSTKHMDMDTSYFCTLEGLRLSVYQKTLVIIYSALFILTCDNQICFDKSHLMNEQSRLMIWILKS